MPEVELEIPARPEYLSLARQVVAAAAALEPTFQDDRIDDLRIAVSEATTNAIEAYQDTLGPGRPAPRTVTEGGEGDSDRIVIRCNLDDDRIEVEVLDRGLGFDPGGVAAPPDAAHPERLGHERGLGIPLMRVLADEAEIESNEDGTAVRLVVYTPARRRRPPVAD